MITDAELDAYAKALAATRAFADGTGDEDAIDYWMAQADQSQPAPKGTRS